MQKYRKRLVLLVLFLALPLAGFLSAPYIIRWWVESHYQGVYVNGRVEITWSGLTVNLTNVKIDRPTLLALLDDVSVDPVAKTIRVKGGQVEVRSSTERTLKETPSTYSISGSQLTLSTVYKDATVLLKQATVNSLTVCFEQGSVYHPRASVGIKKGCFSRDKTSFWATQASTEVTIPVQVPKLTSDQAIVVLDPWVDLDNKTLKFSRISIGSNLEVIKGRLTQHSLEAQFLEAAHPWLGKDGIRIGPVKAALSKKQLDVWINKAHAVVDLESKTVEGDEDCSTWIDALPQPLPEALKDASSNMKGRLSFKIGLTPPDIQLKSTCKYDCTRSPLKQLRDSKFSYLIYNSKGERVRRETGPGTPSWVALVALPDYAPEAFRLLEDPGFLSHRGVQAEALRNSLKINLDTGSFTRGGSTITMQLAKNLWLRRYRSLTRKAEEILLALAVESCRTKAQILEAYINVVEFGPDVYGLGPASSHYFHKAAQYLDADEAFFLAQILPNPKKALAPDRGGLDKARRLMKALAKNGRISEFLIPPEEDSLGSEDDPGWESILP